MIPLKFGCRFGFALALLLTFTLGCSQKPSDAPRVSNSMTDPLKAEKARQIDKTSKSLAADRQVQVINQQLGRPPAPLPVNPTMDVQRSLKTVEEINRINRVNQQLKQNQTQKR